MMADPEKLQVENNTVDADGKFADGYCKGSLYYYDTNNQLPRPLTGEAIETFMRENLLVWQATPRWNAGFVLGWISALCENNPAFFFTSIVFPESAVVTESLSAITLYEA